MNRTTYRSCTTALLTGALAVAVASGCSAEDATAAPQDGGAGSAAIHEAAHSSGRHGPPNRAVRETLATARATSANWHRVEEAEADGYALPPAPAPLHECISATDGPGAMGLHYINGTNAEDTVLDPARPAALVYEPTRNGRLRLVALEYVVFVDAWESAHPHRVPRMFGRKLTLVPDGNRFGLPAFYQVHAWVWKHNPHGRHADHNPRVSCRYADRLAD
ncbi:MAG TPA: hypothetical protein VFG63_16770 [Nocardioidaceae bacterium]|nr:hypothetical protein [Nocardioidaceae bacterium]